MAERDAKVLWPVVVAFLVAAVGVCAALFWPDPATSLRVDNPEHNSAGVSLGVRAGTPYHFITYPLCVVHGQVTIRKVVPRQPTGGIKVIDWALADQVPNGVHDGIPGRAETIRGFHSGPVSNPCTHSQLLAVSVESPGGTATANGFDVQSSSGSVVVPFTVALCDGTQSCPDRIAYSGTP